MPLQGLVSSHGHKHGGTVQLSRTIDSTNHDPKVRAAYRTVVMSSMNRQADHSLNNCICRRQKMWQYSQITRKAQIGGRYQTVPQVQGLLEAMLSIGDLLAT